MRWRFAFVYYNQAKLIYGAEEALALVQEKVAQMEEPLDRRELYWAIEDTEEHEKTNMPELHGDGVFLFNRETIAGADWLEMTEAEAESPRKSKECWTSSTGSCRSRSEASSGCVPSPTKVATKR